MTKCRSLLSAGMYGRAGPVLLDYTNVRQKEVEKCIRLEVADADDELPFLLYQRLAFKHNPSPPSDAFFSKAATLQEILVPAGHAFLTQ